MSRHIIVCKKRLVPFGEFALGCNYYLIVPDHSAGHPDSYTVYRISTHIPLDPYKAIEVVGRELSLKIARKIAKEHGKNE